MTTHFRAMLASLRGLEPHLQYLRGLPVDFSACVTILWHQATESLILSYIFMDNNKQILTFLNKMTYIKD